MPETQSSLPPMDQKAPSREWHDSIGERLTAVEITIDRMLAPRPPDVFRVFLMGFVAGAVWYLYTRE